MHEMTDILTERSRAKRKAVSNADVLRQKPLTESKRLIFGNGDGKVSRHAQDGFQHVTIAEYERAQIAERCRRGKRHKAQQGAVNVLSGAPYGYRYVKKSDSASGDRLL
jgi:hypothetical protein